MITEVILPKLGQTMEEGTIVNALIAVGDKIAKGDVLFEIETDKATLEMESPADGWMIVDGKKVLNFCTNNYLGLADDDRLKNAAKAAIDRYGVGPGAVRTIAALVRVPSASTSATMVVSPLGCSIESVFGLPAGTAASAAAGEPSSRQAVATLTAPSTPMAAWQR